MKPERLRADVGDYVLCVRTQDLPGTTGPCVVAGRVYRVNRRNPEYLEVGCCPLHVSQFNWECGWSVSRFRDFIGSRPYPGETP